MISYSPGARLTILKKPSSFVVASRETLVAVFRVVTVALVTTAPFGSCTRPCKSAALDWACDIAALTNVNIAKPINRMRADILSHWLGENTIVVSPLGISFGNSERFRISGATRAVNLGRHECCQVPAFIVASLINQTESCDIRDSNARRFYRKSRRLAR